MIDVATVRQPGLKALLVPADGRTPGNVATSSTGFGDAAGWEYGGGEGDQDKKLGPAHVAILLSMGAAVNPKCLGRLYGASPSSERVSWSSRCRV